MIRSWIAGAAVDIADKVESPTQRLRALLADKLKRIEERLFAGRVCSESLAAYHAIRRQNPALSGDDLYEAVIARRINLGFRRRPRHRLAHARQPRRLDERSGVPPFATSSST